MDGGKEGKEVAKVHISVSHTHTPLVLSGAAREQTDSEKVFRNVLIPMIKTT